MTTEVEAVERALAQGDGAAARVALAALLQAQAGDAVAALTLRVLAQSPFAPDSMATVADRLVGLLRAQEAQIRTLMALLEAER